MLSLVSASFGMISNILCRIHFFSLLNELSVRSEFNYENRGHNFEIQSLNFKLLHVNRIS